MLQTMYAIQIIKIIRNLLIWHDIKYKYTIYILIKYH